MRWTRGGERPLRLAYCLNLHPAEELEGVLDGLRTRTAPLARRLRAAWGTAPDAPFGIGPWLAGELALALDRDPHDGSGGRARLAELCASEHLDPFTWNAFPFGGFHRAGLKRGVFAPTWAEPARLDYTLAVARIAAELNACATADTGRHVSVSTHTGMFAEDCRGEADRRAVAAGLARCVEGLARLEAECGVRVVLSLEAEPRSLANDTRELAAQRPALLAWGSEVLAAEFGRNTEESAVLFTRHLGACLDTCHAAVEFEDAERAVVRATEGGAPLGKLQFSSALELAAPGADAAGRAALFAMAEPVYLHQVTGRSNGGLVRATDLPDLREEVERELAGNSVGAAHPDGEPQWLDCDTWRCHFHVPVDLAVAGGLGTTRAGADAALAAALARPERWGTAELHAEIETYTWDVLPRGLGTALDAGAAAPDAGRAAPNDGGATPPEPVPAPRSAAELVDGLAREFEHVATRLGQAGWAPDPGSGAGRA